MERTQSRDVDASTWADEHRRKVRGRHGRRDATPSSKPAEATSKATGAEKEPYSDWIEETEQEQEQKQEPAQPPQIKRRAHGHDLGPLYDSARGNRGLLGRRNSRGSRYQHVGQRVPQRERFPANSLHRLLPAEWFSFCAFCSVSQLVLLVLLSDFLRVIARHSGFVFIHQNVSGCTGLIPAIPGVK